MLVAGDERGRTQHGNNNAYCQDNETSWMDWTRDEAAEALTRFVRALTTIRCNYPIFRRSRFLTGDKTEALGVKDVTWITAAGVEMQAEDWDNQRHCFGMLMDGRVQPTGIGRRGEDVTALLILNAFHEAREFTLPEWAGGSHWSRRIDTNAPEPGGPARVDFGTSCSVTGRSAVLFMLQPDTP
jgi:glycogen operon protein